ncbi:MAG: class I SAM-dependent methyltransferase [FCB group bacterium]|nr:class I SAM-dependent methyltransferase [FCB group bacterium]
MFGKIENINSRPAPFEYYTASDLWTDEYTSEQMLKYHLKEDVDLSSRKHKFIGHSVEWIASHFKINNETKIADFGCGPGLYTTKLARKKAQVTGIDFSTRSLEYARETGAKENLTINYINKNYLDFETDDRFDLIIMIMCDFCALSPDQRKTMLDKFNTLLKPGGAVLLDIYSLTAFAKREEAASYEFNQLDGFWSPNKYYGFLNTFVYEKEKVVLDKYTLIEAARTRTIYNWLQYFSVESLEREFTACGFGIENCYSDVAGKAFDSESDEFAVVGRKP